MQQADMRESHQARGPKTLLTIEQARERKLATDWGTLDIPKPGFLGVRVLDPVPLEQIVPFIDWSPFFHTWELRGRYPKILDDSEVGPKARELLDDARALLQKIIEQKLLTAKAVYGFFPANSVGDDIELYTDDTRTTVLTTFHTLRQQGRNRKDSLTSRWRTSSRQRRRGCKTTWERLRSPAASG